MLRSICFEDLSISPMRHLIQNIIFQKMESVGCCAGLHFHASQHMSSFSSFHLRKKCFLFNFRVTPSIVFKKYSCCWLVFVCVFTRSSNISSKFSVIEGRILYCCGPICFLIIATARPSLLPCVIAAPPCCSNCDAFTHSITNCTHTHCTILPATHSSHRRTG